MEILPGAGCAARGAFSGRRWPRGSLASARDRGGEAGPHHLRRKHSPRTADSV